MASRLSAGKSVYRLVVGLAGLMLPILACTLSAPEPLSPQLTPALTAAPSGDWYTLYLTDPTSSNAASFRGGLDEILADDIRQARLNVDVAIYNFNLWSLRDALIAASRNGVSVRVVTESDNLDSAETQELIEAGIPVLGDRRESLMHNKFVIIDHLVVWTGSMNFTTHGAYLNDNNLIRLRSSRLAENFIMEFEEMFIQDFFGNDTLENTPHPDLTIDGVRVETYFSPDDGTAARIVDLIQEAQQSVYFMAYSFTSDEIASALISKASQGVAVAGVFEETQYYSNIGTEFDRLLDAGLDVHLDGNLRNMHHKVIIIDEQIVITGSYNFSASAEESNDENTLIIHSSEIGKAYTAEFGRVMTASRQE
jgi:phosphatidylserine/phosphatidylglycerophosphate/cardiolipin synthase-like enzyme